ncbi:hypothetical protein LTR47_009944 [Exophiala xenobiotica]|nr:hypothetical protein LTR72_011576 [Exophiala xenobiotica]KAK5224187.1 hypothetical protein LTR47_009944 [Exophiala xenobiotica]KAK5284265.1 hypothetical protein LTR40_000543 [Exophiala xenobiotica]KAK5361008.1 hypothetical protein LTS03_010444 [Exophiala xenobiotica]
MSLIVKSIWLKTSSRSELLLGAACRSKSQLWQRFFATIGQTGGWKGPRWSWRPYVALVATACAMSFTLLEGFPIVHAEVAPSSATKVIRLAAVRRHNADAERHWVIKGTKVYDISDWGPNHPGGEVILRAVGGIIDRYWEIFTIHNKKEVHDILDQYYIGDLDPQDLVDGKVP